MPTQDFKGTVNGFTIDQAIASGSSPAYNAVVFPAVQVPSAGNNTLDDYEEGEWDVTITCGTSGTITLDSTMNRGAYTKIGRVVHVQGQVAVDSVSSPVGSIKINLPFAAMAGTELSGRSIGPCHVSGMNWAAGDYLNVFITGGSSFCIIYGTTKNAGGNNEDAGIVGAGDSIIFQLTYFSA